MIIRNLSISVLFATFFLCCTIHEKQKVVDFNLQNQGVIAIDTIGSSILYEWQSDVVITNNSSDTLWIYKSIDSDVLICTITLYMVYSEEINELRYSPDFPMAHYEPILPKKSKKYLLAFSLMNGWTCPVDSYLSITPHFSISLPPFSDRSQIMNDSLIEHVIYSPSYNYYIYNNCNTIQPLKENIDSMFKNRKIDHLYL